MSSAASLNKANKLKRNFYTRELLKVARELPGKILCKQEGSELLSARIVEVEAYDGRVDEAAHTYRGKTPRNEIMFGKGGYLYVYFTYGAHFCSNIVTGEEGHGTAVLIRAVEPIKGTERMIENRFGRELKNEKEIYNLTSGPGKVCSALDLDKKDYGEDLTGSRIYLLDQPVVRDEDLVITTRIGITRSVELPWRFYIKNNPYISRR